MRVDDSLNHYALLEDRSRCGAREAMTVGCKPTNKTLRARPEVPCPNVQPRAHARLTGLTRNKGTVTLAQSLRQTIFSSFCSMFSCSKANQSPSLVSYSDQSPTFAPRAANRGANCSATRGDEATRRDESSNCMLRQHLLLDVSVLITWSTERARPFSCFRFSAILQK